MIRIFSPCRWWVDNLGGANNSSAGMRVSQLETRHSVTCSPTKNGETWNITLTFDGITLSVTDQSSHPTSVCHG